MVSLFDNEIVEPSERDNIIKQEKNKIIFSCEDV